MSTSNTSMKYYWQQYCTLFIGLLTADVTVSQGHLGVKLVKFSVLVCPYILPGTDWLVSLLGHQDTDSYILVKLKTLTLCWNDPDLVSLRTSSYYEAVFSYTDCRHTYQVLTWSDETQTFRMVQFIHMQRAVLMIGYEEVSIRVEHDMLWLIGEIMFFLFMLGDMIWEDWRWAFSQ